MIPYYWLVCLLAVTVNAGIPVIVPFKVSCGLDSTLYEFFNYQVELLEIDNDLKTNEIATQEGNAERFTLVHGVLYGEAFANANPDEGNQRAVRIRVQHTCVDDNHVPKCAEYFLGLCSKSDNMCIFEGDINLQNSTLSEIACWEEE